jgi:dienelactone hydrolase
MGLPYSTAGGAYCYRGLTEGSGRDMGSGGRGDQEDRLSNLGRRMEMDEGGRCSSTRLRAFTIPSGAGRAEEIRDTAAYVREWLKALEDPETVMRLGWSNAASLLNAMARQLEIAADVVGRELR